MGIDSRSINEVNRHLLITKKLLVGIGCSFTEGTSAWDIDLIETYPPLLTNSYGYQDYDLETKIKISKTFLNTHLDEKTNYLNLRRMETGNSYINLLADKFYSGSVTPLNLGLCATGNLSAIFRLFLYPVRYDLVDSITVIFCPTSMQRLDFLRDDCEFSTIVGNTFKTVWTSLATPNSKQNSLWKVFHDGYRECIWSEKFEVLNTILAFSILNFWCKNNNARLVIVPAFDKNYTKEYFKEQLSAKITRDGITQEIIDFQKSSKNNLESFEHYIDLIPWDSFFKPKNQDTFFNLALSQENSLDQSLTMHDFIMNKQISPNKWLMACGHPSAKAHRLFAEELYKHLENNNENCV